MTFRLQDIFLRYAPAIVLVSSVAGVAPAAADEDALYVPFAPPPVLIYHATPPTIDYATCQKLGDPIALSDINARKEKIAELQGKIAELIKPSPGVTQEEAQQASQLMGEKNHLLTQNILERLRLDLGDYSGMPSLVDKLARNGVTLTEVCVAGYEKPEPVVLNIYEDGHAALALNFIEFTSDIVDGGHRLSNIAEKSLEDMDKLEPILVSRAVHYAALSGTSTEQHPILNDNYDPGDLALILTLWRAQAIGEQLIQAADSYATTDNESSFGAVEADFPFLSELITDLRTKSIMLKDDEGLSAEDKMTFRQLVAQTMMNMAEIRLSAYEGVLQIIEDAAKEEGGLKPTQFSHKLTAAEWHDILEKLDQSFLSMHVSEIYDRWDGGEHDPAHNTIGKIAVLLGKSSSTTSVSALPVLNDVTPTP